jgi:hypothetical protein
MCTEVVERRSENDGAIDFEQRLPNLILLFDIPIVHVSHPQPGCCEGVSECFVFHKAFAGVVTPLVRWKKSPALLSGNQKCERRAAMRRSEMTMIAFSENIKAC